MAVPEVRTQSFKYLSTGLDSPTLAFGDFELCLEHSYIRILNNSSFLVSSHLSAPPCRLCCKWFSCCALCCSHFCPFDNSYHPSSWCISAFVFRVRLSGMKIMRPPLAIGHYKMIKHKGDQGNEQNPRRWCHMAYNALLQMNNNVLLHRNGWMNRWTIVSICSVCLLSLSEFILVGLICW